MSSCNGRNCFSFELLILGERREPISLSGLVSLLLFILKEDLKQCLSFVERMDVGFHRLGTAPPHDEAKAFYEIRLDLLISVSTLFDFDNGSADSEMSDIVR